MKTYNVKTAIYCDIEIKVPDSFDPNNYESKELDSLIDEALEAIPEPYDTQSARVVEACGYEVLSIYDGV